MDRDRSASLRVDDVTPARLISRGSPVRRDFSRLNRSAYWGLRSIHVCVTLVAAVARVCATARLTVLHSALFIAPGAS